MADRQSTTRRRRRAGALAAAIALAGLAFAAASPAAAHPHVLVEARATLNFDASGKVPGITLALTLDDMTTSVLVEGLDSNGNGVFDRDELHELAGENAQSLSEFGYFTEIVAATERVQVASLKSYDYRYEDGRLVLVLDLVLERPVDPLVEAMALRLYDPSYYVMVELAEGEPISFAQAPAACAARIDKPDPDGSPELSEALFASDDPSLDNIGRDFADIVTIGCPLHR